MLPVRNYKNKKNNENLNIVSAIVVADTYMYTHESLIAP